jgi:predicted transcriptional regulator of viral defense system
MKAKAVIPDRAGLPSVFSYSKARAAGVSAERLYAFRDQGVVQQIGIGLYQWTDDAPSDQDLLEVAHRAPRGTICLVSALARHGLTDIIPARMDIAIPRGNRVPTLRSPIDIHVFALKTFSLGREKLDVWQGASVGLYSAERSIIDVIRLRHREGSDVAWEALRRWLRRKGSKPVGLLKMAKQFHGAERAVRKALEVVL